MKLSQPVPILRILDEAKAREFYVDFLGFTIVWEHRFDDDAPLYMQISRDGCTIHLSEHYGDCTPGGALRIDTDDVEGLNRELLEKHYKYARPGVSDTPWRTREMSIKDPFGNRLVFSQPLDRAKASLDAGDLEGMTPVGLTARWMAANRALETERANPLYRDPLARELAGPSGFAMMAAMRAALGAPNGADPDVYLTIRTKFFDDAMVRATRESSMTQAVILAAGMDARAFRIDWPPGLTLFEVDREDVFERKEPMLQPLNARPACDRRIVRADLSQPWSEALIDAGFDPNRPAAILIEGLLMYLDEPAVTRLLSAIATIAREGSWLGLDAVNTHMLTSPYTAGYMKKLAEAGCPWKFGVNEPEPLLATYGWQATVVMPGGPEANYERWPFPVVPRTIPGMPRAYFVHARKIGDPG